MNWERHITPRSSKANLMQFVQVTLEYQKSQSQNIVRKWKIQSNHLSLKNRKLRNSETSQIIIIVLYTFYERCPFDVICQLDLPFWYLLAYFESRLAVPQCNSNRFNIFSVNLVFFLFIFRELYS